MNNRLTSHEVTENVHLTSVLLISLRLFNNLPQAFQCKIVSDVTLQSREDFTNEAMSETWSAISQKLLLLDISADECVDTSPRKIVSSTHVQIGVRLRKGMPLEAWLERFRKILPTIYLAYVSKIGRVSEFVSGWTKNHNGAKIPLIAANQFLVKVEEAPATDASVAMVSFSLYSRDTSGDYRLIKGDDVAASLEAIGRAVLNSYVQAEVIGWRAHREREDARFERMRKRKYKPSSLETVRLQSYFPKYLVKFFKSMKNDGRCYVLRQISSSVKLDLLAVERHYHSIKMLPKKYYCSRGGKYNSKAHEKQLGPLASVWERLDTYIRSVSNPTSKPILMTTIVPQVQNSTVIRETRPLNSMEIVMFVLLGFLCLLIMVFVANCIVFTFKTKKLNTSYTANIHAPQVVFGDIDGVKDDGVTTTVCPSGKITLTENLQPAKSVFSVGKFPNGNHWRFLSLASDSGVTVCSDAPSLSEEESERVSSV